MRDLGKDLLLLGRLARRRALLEVRMMKDNSLTTCMRQVSPASLIPTNGELVDLWAAQGSQLSTKLALMMEETYETQETRSEQTSNSWKTHAEEVAVVVALQWALKPYLPK